MTTVEELLTWQDSNRIVCAASEMERQDGSCSDLAYSTSVAMHDREVSSSVLNDL